MRSTKSLLSVEKRNELLIADKIDLSTVTSPKSNTNFIVELDARPLVALFDAAQHGSRLYELMTISRPADVLHYLHLTMLDVDENILNDVKRTIKFKTRFKDVTFENGISFIEFDSCFISLSEDSNSHERNWLTHRRSSYWYKKMQALFAVTKIIQQRVLQLGDFVVQNELKLIEQGLHHRDLLPHIDRLPILVCEAYSQTKLPLSLFQAIEKIIKQNDVKSVSCYLSDYPLWRILVEEQIRRAQLNNLPPQEVFFLSGSDGVQMNLTGADNRRYPNEPADWGGVVHVPYEGTVGADLFIKPDWHNFRKELAGENGSLSRALFDKPCRYMFSEIDYGELGCATRTQIGNWFLYRCNNAL